MLSIPIPDPVGNLRQEIDRLPRHPDGSITIPPELLDRFFQALRLSEERIVKTMDTNPDAQLISREEDGLILVVNDGFERLFGYRRDEVIGKTSLELGLFANPTDRQQAAQRLQEQGAFHELELAVRTRSGEIRQASISAERFNLGGEAQTLTMIRDVTQRQQAEEARRQNEERFRTSVDTMLDGFAIYSAVRDPDSGEITDFRYEYINEAGCRMNRRTREQTVGHTLLGLLPAHRAAGIFDEYVRVVETGQPLVRENLVYEDIFGGERLRRVFDHEAVKLGDGFALTWRDVTQHRKMDEALQESEAQLKRSQAIAHLGSWELDLVENRLIWSDEVYRIFGLQPQEFGATYEAFLAAVHPEDRAAVDAAYSGSIRDGRNSYEIEHRVVRANTGEIRTVHEKCEHVRDADGEIIRSIGMVHDITDRKNAEEKLRESEQRYRELFETMQEGLVVAEVITDEAGKPVDYRYLDVNPVTERQFGLSREQFVGHTYTEVLPDADPEWIQIFGRVGLTGDTVSMERYSRVTGRWFYCHLYSPRPGQVVDILTDITERIQAEDALRRSEEKYRQYFDQLREAVMVFKEVRDDRGEVVDWEFMDVNQASLRILGFPSEQVVGKRIREVFGTEFVARYEATYGRMLDIGDASFHEVAFLDRHFHVSIFRLDENRVASVGLDITERKQAEEALRTSEARFRLALEEAPISVATMDKDLRYTWVYQPRGGIPPETMLGMRDDELLPAEDMAELMALKQAVLDTGQGMRQELRLRTARGWRHFLYHLEPMRDAAGEVNGVRSAVLDITDQRVLEQAVTEQLTRVEVQRRLIEQREQERLQIARDLHDGPLQNLTLLSFELSNAAQMALDSRLQAAIQSAIETLLGQIDELRQFTTELRPSLLGKFGLAKAIRAHANSLQEKKPDLQLHLDLQKESPPLSETIRLTLYRIYQEAVNNIVKHAQASRVWVRFGMESETATLEIQDNGVGFTLPGRWFDLARQGHLGLVGMQERAEAVGGALRIDSRPGQGTSLQVTVPVPVPPGVDRLPPS